ncbi:ABC transporter ATP-binding protein [Gracilinema caldarium]|uniref:Sulfate-transporting ATPase n=1 Tax=Gracilinema caldarium (strain ATCC 51460 / DSM 7334 / H1) TaxID=744872 RepID=F8F2N8_GRAC1|nr:ABC transporter ATP-binding protein [Gracilinema caldarium]AEJ19432.1 Sulfate-transporting ATPase [Gracilinema caldarium DSM 7334]
MIEVQHLSKQYGNVQAVRDVSFQVGTGQVIGLLGPNGAGKTTIMKILTGYHFPSSGVAYIDGLSVEDYPEEIKKKIGYLPENAPSYGDLTPLEYLSFVAEARQLPKEKRQNRINEVMALCSIQEVRNKPIETLSKGYRQRLGLAQAIIHDPAILILDEPTTGLDPNQILEIRSLIRELGKSKTVILSTHILQEVEAVCSQVIIIHQGRIAAQGTSVEIGRTLKGQDSWKLALRGNLPQQLPQNVIFNDKKFIIQTQSRSGDGTISISISYIDESTMDIKDPQLIGETIFDWVVAQGYKIIHMEHQKVSLEDIFVQLTKEGDAK